MGENDRVMVKFVIDCVSLDLVYEHKKWNRMKVKLVLGDL